jgi:hypothetical protein
LLCRWHDVMRLLAFTASYKHELVKMFKNANFFALEFNKNLHFLTLKTGKTSASIWVSTLWNWGTDFMYGLDFCSLNAG